MLFILFLGALGIGAGVVYLRGRLVEWEPFWTWRRLAWWTFQGIVAPLGVFLVYLSGAGGLSPPVISYIAKQGGLSWGGVFWGVAGAGLGFIVTFWGAVTFGWFLRQVFVRVPAEEHSQFWGLSGVWAALTLPIWLGLIFWLGWGGSGLAISLCLASMVHGALPLADLKKRGPAYSRAIGLIKLGKFPEAELEVIGQLETHEEDFAGWILLAELYAVHFRDIGAAEETLAQLIQQDGLTDAQLAEALNRLADWQLKLGQDPIGARLTLEEISRRFPGTNLDRLAGRRIEQLPASREELLDRQRARPVRLPAGVDPFASRAKSGQEEEAFREANLMSERLTRNPNDVEARETFAWLLADSLGKVDLAFDQLGLLMEMTEHSDRKMARWLAMAAAWEMRHRKDREASRSLMEKLVREHPESPEAFAAQRRLKLIEMENRLSVSRARQESIPKPRI